MRPPPSSRNAGAPLRVLLGLAALSLTPWLLLGAAPSWWAAQGVTAPSATPDDYALAVQGQVKTLAVAAYSELQNDLPPAAWTTAAGTNLTSFVTALSTNQNANYAPINLGQLKTVAVPFYDILIAQGLSTAYPWTGSPTPPNDYAPATLGQVKTVFSFDPSVLLPYQIFALSGDAQDAALSSALSSPLAVQVTDTNGNPIAGATVTFSATQGTLSAATATTDATGQAQVSYTTPASQAQATVTASVTRNGQTAQVTFTAYAGAPPSFNVTATVVSPTEIDVSWTNPISNATSVTLQVSNDGGATWTDVATLDGNATSYVYSVESATPMLSSLKRSVAMLSPNISSVNGSTSGQSFRINSTAPGGSSSSNTAKAVPPPRYAVVDLGANQVPTKITDSGYVLGSDGHGSYSVWHNGTSLALQGGAVGYDSLAATDIDEDGTVVGVVNIPCVTANVLSYNAQQNDEIASLAQWAPGAASPSLTAPPQIPFIGLATWSVTGYLSFGGDWMHGDASVRGSLAPRIGNGSVWSIRIVGVTSSAANESGWGAALIDGFLDGSEQGTVTYTGSAANPTRDIAGKAVFPVSINSSGQSLVEIDSSYIVDPYGFPGWVSSAPTFALGTTPVAFTPAGTLGALSNVAQGITPATAFILGSDSVFQTASSDGTPPHYTAPTTFFCWNTTGNATQKQYLPQPSGNLILPAAVNAATGTVLDSSNNPVAVPAPQIVGNGNDPTNLNQTGYLWEADPATGIFGPPQDLNDLIPQGTSTNAAPWTVTGVVHLNDAGAIVGTATYAPQGTGDPIAAGNHGMALLPCDNAPQVLRVNSNFDEQKINSSTHYAQADNYDEDLKAAIGPKAGKIIVTDLNPNFFGVKPGTLPNAFYEGAVVTIKKLDATDGETNKTEAGTVRLYAIQNLGQTGEQAFPIPISNPGQSLPSKAVHPFTTSISTDQPANLVPVLYSDSATIPQGQNVAYYMEGVDPGPITLEFRIHNAGGGSVPDVVFTQKFTVCTQQGKADWQADIRQEILLQSGVDMAAYTGPAASAPFMTDKTYVQTVYAYYQELYQQNPRLFLWAGLAKMAGGPVYAGLSDAEYGRRMGEGVTYAIPLTAELTGPISDFVQSNLILGNYDIFDDLAWQFRAYQASGIRALRYADDHNVAGPSLQQFNIVPWNDMYKSDYSFSTPLTQKANLEITNREQQFIVQPAWTKFHEGDAPDWMYSILAHSPLPGGVWFFGVAGYTADITTFNARWAWITNLEGIWNQWIDYSPNEALSLVAQPLPGRADSYSIFYFSRLNALQVIW